MVIWYTALASWTAAVPSPGAVEMSTQVGGRHVFYDNSSFDTGPGKTNDDAVALGKKALRPSEKATFANYTSYVSGINGIVVDVFDLENPAGLARKVDAGDVVTAVLLSTPGVQKVVLKDIQNVAEVVARLDRAAEFVPQRRGNFDQLAIGGHARKDHTGMLEFLTITVVEFKTMAVAFLHFICKIKRG